MNWRSRIQNAIHIQLSHKFPPNSAKMRVEIHKAIKRTLDKCRLKYTGTNNAMLRMPNDINTIKKYIIGKNTYKITTSIETNRNGWVGKSTSRLVEKKHYTLWKFVSYSNSYQAKENKQ